MEKAHPVMKLLDAIENLFASGADEDTTEDELLALLDGLCWSKIVNSIVHNAVAVYEYSVDGPLRYRGKKLVERNAFQLYQQTQPAQIVEKTTYQRCLELWICEDMELFVASCFRISSGSTVTEYRDFKSHDWLDTELEIDFPTLARNLKTLCELAEAGNTPFYEVNCK